MGAAPLFDRIVIVDWSANAAPKTGKDSIWVAEAVVATGDVRSVNLRTRHVATEFLEHVVGAPDDRVLVGVDFSLGFPRGTAAALGLATPAWTAMWAELATRVCDDVGNLNNRFSVAADLNALIGPGPGPFWGCPPSKATDSLTPTKVACDPLPQWRTVETLLRSRGRRPFSSWQLTGAGAVGSQSLVGIAAMERLLARVRAAGRSVDVWPFTTGVSLPTAEVVLVEVWPTLVDLPDTSGDRGHPRVRDQLQVEAAARRLASQELASLFTPTIGVDSVGVVIDEEGWVFGVT